MDDLANRLEKLGQLDPRVADAMRGKLSRDLTALGDGPHDKEVEVVCDTIRGNVERSIKALES